MKKDTRSLLLEVGVEMISINGFNNTGIAEVLKAAGVPKGSFYHYFDSKDDFGIQVIDHFCVGYFEWIEQFLGDKDYTPLTRLRALIQEYMVRFKAKNYACGCLFGSLSQELAGQSELFRAKLQEAFEKLLLRLEALFAEGQACGEIPSTIRPRDLAEFYLNAVEGTIIRCKVLKSDAPMDLFLAMFFEHLCKIQQPLKFNV